MLGDEGITPTSVLPPFKGKDEVAVIDRLSVSFCIHSLIEFSKRHELVPSSSPLVAGKGKVAVAFVCPHRRGDRRSPLQIVFVGKSS